MFREGPAVTQDIVAALQVQVLFAKKGEKAAPTSCNHTEGEIGRRMGNRSQSRTRVG